MGEYKKSILRLRMDFFDLYELVKFWLIDYLAIE